MLRKAAFFRLERGLHANDAWKFANYVARNAASIRVRATAAGSTWVAGLLRHGAGREAAVLAYAALAGFTRDRIELLSEDYARDEVLPGIPSELVELVRLAHADGYLTVLLSEAPRSVAALVGDAMGFDRVVANDLEYDQEGHATGQFKAPLQGPSIDGRWLRAYAAEQQVDLAASRAYGGQRFDIALLSAVADPCAIDPDAELTRVARDLAWPIVRPLRGVSARRSA